MDIDLDKKIDKPKKAHYRQRAHCNPLTDSGIHAPLNPDCVNWAVHYPAHFGLHSHYNEASLKLNTSDCPIEYQLEAADVNGSSSRSATILDIGCGYGGLLFFLARHFPDDLILGMEIRQKVTNYVGRRILAARAESEDKDCTNVSVIRTNVMKHLVNYIRKGQLRLMFFCYPDPHFKKSNWRRRIINHYLLCIYAYCLQVGGCVYFVTDVKDLFDWMHLACSKHSLFEEVPQAPRDPIMLAIEGVTEEGQKVSRGNKPAWSACFRRLPDPIEDTA
eukprot:Platyproteum_vivax@DN7831_c0_g1_i1.p1